MTDVTSCSRFEVVELPIETPPWLGPCTPDPLDSFVEDETGRLSYVRSPMVCGRDATVLFAARDTTGRVEERSWAAVCELHRADGFDFAADWAAAHGADGPPLEVVDR